MFLKTVPPVVAIRSEWRSSKSCSLPIFFNDSASDSDLASVSGTPLPQKIQMIIEGLHSTQSSDMSENGQTEKAAHSSHEPGYKGQMRLMDMAARSRRPGSDAKLQTNMSDSGDDSDSDDSVDRGIEKAIQEYLKEKVDQKRKGDPMTSSPPAPKLQRREPTLPDAAKQHTHSSSAKVLTASNHIQRVSSGMLALKKIKKKKLSKDNPFKKVDASKILPSLPPSRAKKGSSSSSEMDRSPPRLVIKEEYLDSSSDDGIEEEIQRFQQEKKDKQEGDKDAVRSSQQTKDSDSSSDEGIEEAIRRFQEEKHKQNKKICPAQLVPAQLSKPAAVSQECMNTQPLKVLSKKKNNKKLSTNKSNVSKPLGHFLKAKGLTPTSPKQTPMEHQIHPSMKVNTAELMCAEAILDISKTVMPEVFESSLNRNLLQTPIFPSVAPPEDKSDDSSIDSEDGIEQEIRKFLEHKAKMTKEAPGTPSGDPSVSKEPKKKSQPSKAVRLSLSKKRKLKEDQSQLSRDGDLVLNVKEEPPGTPLICGDSTKPELSVMSHLSPTAPKNNKPKLNSPPRKGADLKASPTTSSPKTAVGSERNDSSDKSSSFDSDEDLDAAIKDLLKTKKKVKKKVREMKARKGGRPFEASSLDATKRVKSVPLVKASILKGGKPDKCPKSKTVKGKSEKHDKVTGNGGVPLAQGGDAPSPSLHADDDSSVDSDDSIEREIRRFLAERAKVSTPVVANIKQEEEAINPLTLSAESEVKPELQIDVTASRSRLCKSEVIGTPSKSTDTELNKGPVLTPGSSCIMGFGRTESQPLNDPMNGSSSESHSIKPKSFTPSYSEHQNLFLMRPVNNRMNEAKEPSSTDCKDHQNRSAPRIPLREVISSLCPSPLSKPQSSSLGITTGDLSTEGVYVHNRLKRDRHFSERPHLSTTTSHLCQPLPELKPQQGVSVIQIQRDQVFQSTSHQAIESPAILGHREGERVSKEDEEEKCIDETDVESDEERKEQKTDTSKQPTKQFLSTSIDPGILISPYIALDTSERSLKFRSRRVEVQKQLKGSKAVKRKLQFVVSFLR